MKIQLSDEFDYKKLIRFTAPSVVMMIFTSVYGVVDGFFISNYVGKTAFAAVNLIIPFLMILGAIGFMFGAGGSALIAKTMGEGEDQKARELFSLFVNVTIISGIVIAALSFIFIRPIAVLLGANEMLLEDCVTYGRIMLCSLPFYMLQFEFQSYFVTAERLGLGLAVTIIAGVTNMVLDGLFMAVFGWGVIGAATATSISLLLGGGIPLVYFGRKNTSRLQLVKAAFDGKALFKACTNGSSELMNNVSMSLVSMLYNLQLMKYAAEDGVAAYGVLMYVCMIFLSVFLGYSNGVAPIIGYHFGAKNKEMLKGLLKKSIVIIGLSSIMMVILGEVLAQPLSKTFVGYDSGLFAMTERGFFIFSFSYIFTGLGIFGSAFFTALNDGLTSALISFLRTMVFQVSAVLILPIFFGLDGIWASIVVAEALAVVVTFIFMKIKKEKYGY